MAANGIWLMEEGGVVRLVAVVVGPHSYRTRKLHCFDKAAPFNRATIKSGAKVLKRW